MSRQHHRNPRPQSVTRTRVALTATPVSTVLAVSVRRVATNHNTGDSLLLSLPLRKHTRKAAENHRLVGHACLRSCLSRRVGQTVRRGLWSGPETARGRANWTGDLVALTLNSIHSLPAI